MTSKSQIGNWFDEGVARGATHMIVVCDTFDHDDYPVYVGPQEDVYTIEKRCRASTMQRVMEVYCLQMDKQSQLDEYRSWNYEPPSPAVPVAPTAAPAVAPTEATLRLLRGYQSAQARGSAWCGVAPPIGACLSDRESQHDERDREHWRQLREHARFYYNVLATAAAREALADPVVLPSGYKVSSLNIGNRGPLWQAQLAIDHPLEDNTEAGAIAACRRHREVIVGPILRDLWRFCDCEAARSSPDRAEAFKEIGEEIGRRLEKLER